MAQIAIPDNQIEEIKRVISLDESKISRVLAEFSKVDEVKSRKELTEIASNITGEDEADSLVSMCGGFANLIDDPKRSTEQLLALFKEALEGSNFSESEIRRFETIMPILKELIESDAMYLSVKSGTLINQTADHIHEFKITVDIKPLFNEGRSRMNGTMLYYMLSITHSDPDESEGQLRLTMGEARLKKVIRECERALKKMEIVESDLKRANLPWVTVYGRDSDKHS